MPAIGGEMGVWEWPSESDQGRTVTTWAESSRNRIGEKVRGACSRLSYALEHARSLPGLYRKQCTWLCNPQLLEQGYPVWVGCCAAWCSGPSHTQVPALTMLQERMKIKKTLIKPVISLALSSVRLLFSSILATSDGFRLYMCVHIHICTHTYIEIYSNSITNNFNYGH